MTKYEMRTIMEIQFTGECKKTILNLICGHQKIMIDDKKYHVGNRIRCYECSK